MLNWFKDYIAGPTHQWWMDHVWKPAWDKVITFIYGIPAAALAVGQYVSTFMQDNTIQSYMAQFNIPNWVPSALTLIALLYYIAHGRTQDK